MDRFSFDGSGKQLIYQAALEFMGEVRAGMSWKRFSAETVRYSDVFIDILNGTDTVRRFASEKNIDLEYLRKQVRDIFQRLHFDAGSDHYMTLLLPRSASAEQINKRWKDLMLIYHPDRSGNQDAAGCAKRINAAYDILKNPGKKREYDMRTMMNADTHVRTNRRRFSPSQRSVRPSFISPKVRRLLPKLIIPCSILISFAILLTIFLINRLDPYLPQTTVTQGEQGLPAEKKDSPLIQKNSYQAEVTPTAPLADVGSFYREAQEEQRRPQRFQTEHITARREKAILKTPEPRHIAQVDKTVEDVSTPPPENNTMKEVKTVSLGNLSPAAVANKSSEKKNTSSKTIPTSTPGGHGGGIQGETSGSRPDEQSLEAKLTAFETEVFFFMVQYINAYEEGDISRFMTFFSQSAVENGSRRYDDIRRSYKKNFETAKYSYMLKNLKIREEDNVTVVTGDYSIKRLTGGNARPAVTGKARWSLVRENGSLKIARIDYDKR
jgi:hypothetical protein